ncbi:MAG: NAD(P)H-binding protein [Pseudolabrys sp.]|jgi:putative NADH-flavin reductase
MGAVLIIGASRGIGLETVKLALKAGYSVRALSRSATAIRLHDRRLEKLDGNALNPDTIERALVGVGAVIQTLGVPRAPKQILGRTRLFSTATRVLVDAMEATGVKRLICVTGLGAGDSRGHGGPLYNAALCIFLGRVYADKDVQERIIRRSRLDWTIVRPTILTNGPRTGRFRVLVNPRDWTPGFISRADVADFLVKQIDDESLLHKAPVLRGIRY